MDKGHKTLVKSVKCCTCILYNKPYTCNAKQVYANCVSVWFIIERTLKENVLFLCRVRSSFISLNLESVCNIYT